MIGITLDDGEAERIYGAPECLDSYAPVLLAIGTDDEEVSPRICQALNETGTRDGDRIEFVLYRGAEHDFDDPGNKKQSVPANRKAREDSMRRAETFFARYLKR